MITDKLAEEILKKWHISVSIHQLPPEILDTLFICFKEYHEAKLKEEEKTVSEEDDDKIELGEPDKFKSYEAKLKEELIKYDKWLVDNQWGEMIHTPEQCADEYLKTTKR